MALWTAENVVCVCLLLQRLSSERREFLLISQDYVKEDEDCVQCAREEREREREPNLLCTLCVGTLISHFSPAITFVGA